MPISEEVRELVERRIATAAGGRDARRLFVGPRGGRIGTAVLRDAAHWADVVAHLGYEHPAPARSPARWPDLRLADAGALLHHLQRIAGHAVT